MSFDKKLYNRMYYLKNRERILLKAREYHFKTKKLCPICGKLISRESKKCVSCVLAKRNKSKKQREIVSRYWKGRIRNKWLEGWRKGKIKELTKEDVKNLDDNWIKLLGWILTDGYINKKWGNVILYQTKENGKEKIRKILNSLGIEWKEYEVRNYGKKSETMFYIPSKFSRMVLEKLGLKDKKLPKWTGFLNKHQIIVLLNSMLDGDGCRRKYNTSLSGNYENLKEIFNLLISKGISCSLSTNSRGDSYIYIHQGQL